MWCLVIMLFFSILSLGAFAIGEFLIGIFCLIIDLIAYWIFYKIFKSTNVKLVLFYLVLVLICIIVGLVKSCN